MKAINGYENYTISDDGVVRNKKGKIKSFFDNNGYKSVALYKNGKSKVFFVHRLVAIHFIPNPNNKPCVNHKDFNRANNNIENLEWCTYSENERHKIKHKGYERTKFVDVSMYHDLILEKHKDLTIDELSRFLKCNESVLRKYMRSLGLYYYKGFTYEKSRKKFKVTLWKEGKSILVGRYNTQEEATEAYKNSKLNLTK